ncbi:hypothetical protein B0H14DRAFT_2678916 [Mycena olivaceomarginata]|nr:hypothetical protein B0H14DRAFT_2678916 [Mycena olivaceomarginata]
MTPPQGNTEVSALQHRGSHSINNAAPPYPFFNAHSRTESALDLQEVTHASQPQARIHGHVEQVNLNNYTHHHYYVSHINAGNATPLPSQAVTIINSDPRLLPILSVAVVFRHPGASVLQISRVLEMDQGEVAMALQPFLGYLKSPPTDFSSEIKIPLELKDALIYRTGKPKVNARKYHELVAKWCLGPRRPSDALIDISYASESWVYHLCNANPSDELYEVLRNSSIPMDPLSHDELQHVVDWLIEEGNSQARDLIENYEAQIKGRNDERDGSESQLITPPN